MILKKALVLLCTLYLFIASSWGAEGTTGTERRTAVISGYLKDATNGEALIGATVYIKELNSGTISNIYGFYSLAVPPGKYTVTFAYLGFQTKEQIIDILRDVNLNVNLKTDSEEIDEVTVISKRPDENVTVTQMGVERMQSKTIKSVPVLMGEVDPIKVLQLLPGVKATSEGSSGFSVRGGSPDHNLVLLDEATVYNAGHLMGFFSVFNNDAIKDINLYKGDIPCQNGGRLASLLDVRMKEGNTQDFTANGGIGLISSRLTLEGPIGNENTSFIMSGRRSYMDIFFPLMEESIRDNKLYFYDFNAKVNHTFNENNRLYLSGYFGRDLMKDGSNGFDYGNQTFTARWNHVFSPRLFSNFTFVTSRYDYELGGDSEGNTDYIWNARLVDYGCKMDFIFYANPNNTISFGTSLTYHKINPGFAKGTGDDALLDNIQMPYSRSLEGGTYLSNTQKITPRLSMRYGVRFSNFHNMGSTTFYEYNDNFEVQSEKKYGRHEVFNSFFNLEPRIGGTFMLNSKSSLKASYSHNVQYLQMASNSTSGSPLDVWFPASPNIKPQKSDQYAIGYFRNMQNNSIETSFELFYKDMQNAIDFRDHAELLLNKHLEGEMRPGNGYAYGAEMMVRLNKESYSGWISYTFSRAFRTIPGINQGKEYRSPYDRPHDISVVLNRKVGKRGQLSVNWVYTSGVPITAPVGRMMVGNTVYTTPSGQISEVPGSIVPIYSQRNAERMPDYHRMDIGYTLKCKNNKNRKWQGEWNFSIYNIYNRHNAWMVSFEQDEKNPLKTKATKTYLFPAIPSVTYNFKF